MKVFNNSVKFSFESKTEYSNKVNCFHANQ